METVNWPIIGIMATILSMITGTATAYLRLFMAAKLSEMKNEILSMIKTEFTSKEITDIRFSDINSRVKTLEDWHSRAHHGT